MIFESPNIRVALDDQIATLTVDCADNADNRLTLQVLDDLERALRAVQRISCLDLLVLRSGKPDVFSIGYDLTEFAALKNPVERSAFAARGQQVAQLLSHLGKDIITVALIEGACRSGGLELALACDYRIARIRNSTRLVMPEVNRGTVPCWGGTLRLACLVGLQPSINLLLRSRELAAREAKKMGLVDEAFADRPFDIYLQSFIDRLQDAPRRLPLPRSVRQRLPFSRWFAVRGSQKWLSEIDANDRPAAHAVVDCIMAGLSSPAEGLAAERKYVADLGDSVALRTVLKQLRRAEQSARIFPEPTNPVPPLPERIGIVGAGKLGASLACSFGRAGYSIVLQADNEDALRDVSDRMDRTLDEDFKRGQIDADQIELIRKNIRRTVSWNGFENAGLVVEAAEDDLGVKRSIFHELEKRARPRTILASTSSALCIEAMQAELQYPGRVVGLHFPGFDLENRVVELVRSPTTDSATLATLDSWLRTWGKMPIIVSDRPGRLVMRVHLAYLSEAVTLVAEGLPPALIDREMRRFGMARGPLETIDAIGFDNLARLVEDIQLARGDRFCRNLLLDRMRAYGWNGRENEGFYRYGWGRRRENHLARMVLWRDLDDDVVSHYVFDPQDSLSEGVDRLVLRTVNEAAACLADERDADPDLVDLALSWGMGWAPHRGGPLQHADTLGLATVFEQLNDFADRFGKRFLPCVELQRLADATESFYNAYLPAVNLPFALEHRLAG